ncbi:glycerophosphodiester phosphodiesterase [Levilactobacillus bambusae]|uniref:GP-PDE domain-containing protein n=1 Tax=Levilactobacillus bambusae TaxID=2024736 RepID=A0A2V1MZJ5_9LACO|nr:glycerophosphodiester phosphodiesterase [Levilactobacillus bambusae]PWF99545.1 hypothetical protein DCM90_08870 [Levilactobacillus bambusae]
MVKRWLTRFKAVKSLFKVQTLTQGWLIMMAIIVTLHLLLLGRGHLWIKLFLSGLFLIGLPLIFTIFVLVIGQRRAEWSSEELTLTALKRVLHHAIPLVLFEGLTLLVGMPLGNYGLTSAFLARLKLPSQWINVVGMHRQLIVPLVIFIYLLILGFWLQYLQVPVQMIVKDQTWRQTRQKWSWWRLSVNLRTLIKPVIGMVIPMALVSELIVGLNWWLDQVVRPGSAMLLGWISLVGLEICLLTMTGILLAMIIWRLLDRPVTAQLVRPNDVHPIPWFAGMLVLILMGLLAWDSLQPVQNFRPSLTISHRGVNKGNGVQNTIPALVKTAKLKPDRVELDVHETKDGQFVVLHDETLKHLAGKNVTPHQLTLRELQQITVRENGTQTHLTGFSAYLRVAEHLHQRLIVEIKSTPEDSSNLVKHFDERYGARLVKDHSWVHAINYDVVTQLKKRDSQLKVGYITTLNFFSPDSVPADFYSFQRNTVGKQFVMAAHNQHVPAYIWTPDSRFDMIRMFAIGTDGQITNRVRRLQNVLNEPRSKFTWAILQNFLFSLL